MYIKVPYGLKKIFRFWPPLQIVETVILFTGKYLQLFISLNNNKFVYSYITVMLMLLKLNSKSKITEHNYCLTRVLLWGNDGYIYFIALRVRVNASRHLEN